MNELEVIRRECEALPEPDDRTIASARAALLVEIETWSAVERQRPRRRLLRGSLVLAAGLAVLVTVLFAFVIPAKRSPIGVKVAAAADEALIPSNGDIVHASSHTRVVLRSKVGGKTTISTSDDEWWAASGSPSAVFDRYGRGLTILTTSCGQISYDPVANLISVSPSAEPAQVLASNPSAAYRNAYRHGNVHYRGMTTFHSIPAVTLHVTQNGAVITMIVRRDNGYPLKTVTRRETAQFSSTYVATYSTFEHLPRTKRNERLLQLPPHPGAFYVRLPAGAATAQGCKGFGGFESLTERKAKP
jgi:hypothetical protein